jgi:predicted transcriptional regulator
MSLDGLGASVVRSGVRVKILKDLERGPKTPTELASLESEHLSHVCRALAQLRAQGLVSPMPGSSKERYYTTTEMGLELCAAVIHATK